MPKLSSIQSETESFQAFLRDLGEVEIFQRYISRPRLRACDCNYNYTCIILTIIIMGNIVAYTECVSFVIMCR